MRSAIYDLSLEREQYRPFDVLLGELVDLQSTIAPHLQIALEVQEGILEGPLGETGREILRIIGEAMMDEASMRPAKSPPLLPAGLEEGLAFGRWARGPTCLGES